MSGIDWRNTFNLVFDMGLGGFRLRQGWLLNDSLSGSRSCRRRIARMGLDFINEGKMGMAI